MKKLLAITTIPLAALTLTACGSSEEKASGPTHITVGQTTPFDCDGDDCAAAFTIEKADVGNTCEEMGADYLKWDGAGPNETRRIAIDTLIKANSEKGSYDVGFEWNAVTANGVLRPMEMDVDCGWPGKTNSEVGGTSVPSGSEKLWGQAFLLPDDATAIRIVNFLNDEQWELPL